MDKSMSLAKKLLDEEKWIIKDLKKYLNIKTKDSEEKKLIQEQIKELETELKENHKKMQEAFNDILFSKPLEIEKKPLPGSKKPQVPKLKPEEVPDEPLRSPGGQKYSLKQISPRGLEKETINRIKEERNQNKNKKVKKTSDFSKLASQIFSKYSRKLLGKKSFKRMEDELIKANLDYTPVGYMSTILFATMISFLISGFLFLFFLFFNLGAELPIITRTIDPINIRFFKVVWILLVLPLLTFFFMYFYPSLERRSEADLINSELPFATINMAAISGSMVDPSKIFEILISTGEYPALQKQFTKMLNQIDLYGYDLVTALRDTAENNPSKELSELLNGLSVTIHSGGDLVKFFDKRSQTLMFNYKIEQQRQSKAAETSMDIYISMAIASPMILMLLLMIMKISGLGISMGTDMISLLVILGVFIINILFIASFHMRGDKK